MSTVLVLFLPPRPAGRASSAAIAILQLLAAGHQVRTTVRSLKREGEVRAMLKGRRRRAGRPVVVRRRRSRKRCGLGEAVAGCEYVLHVASPFPAEPAQARDELIVPAREGALRVLRASRDAGVKRVVLTSSFAAIGYGHKAARQAVRRDRLDRSGGEGVSPPTQIEDHRRTRGVGFHRPRRRRKLELSVVNPVGVFGPGAGSRLFDVDPHRAAPDGRRVPGCPKIYFGAVDVRDVADLHIRAMTDPAAKGERFLAVAGDFLSMLEIAKILKAAWAPPANACRRGNCPTGWCAWRRSRSGVRQILPELGKKKNATNEKAKRGAGLGAALQRGRHRRHRRKPACGWGC
jgi:nucleoside-diphosphate-sugar epimerase